MSKKIKDLCIKAYNYKNKEYFEVIVQKRDKSGRRIKKKSRFTEYKKRITSLQSAERVKFR